ATGLHVLIADDAEINREVAMGVLELFGHTCETATSGVEAVEAATRSKFDIILMDIEMPNMDGLEATRRIRELEGDRYRTPIVAMTAHALAGTDERCLAA